MTNKVSVEDVEKNIGFSIDPRIQNKIISTALKYSFLNEQELKKYITEFRATISSELKKSGKHRINDWESGWKENLLNFKKNKKLDSLIPKYHIKSNISRLNGKVIKTKSPKHDFLINSFFMDSILFKYIENYERVFEFGCGTGYHLFRLNENFPSKQYIGLDWAKLSQEIIQFASNCLGTNNIKGKNFDYYKPDPSINIKDSLVFTVASLEQVGDQHSLFINYILNNKPALVINFEPITELLNKNILLDDLTIQYIEKRNYLKNYLTSLISLEKMGKVKILEARRLNYGSQFIEGHSLIIWKPL